MNIPEGIIVAILTPFDSQDRINKSQVIALVINEICK